MWFGRDRPRNLSMSGAPDVDKYITQKLQSRGTAQQAR